MNIRRAMVFDLPGVVKLYDDTHEAERRGIITTGWLPGVYPVRATAEAALQRGDLFVMEESNQIYGSALINQIQVDVYEGAPWEHDVPPDQVCVLHTMMISPKRLGRGLGPQFVQFYEEYALEHGSHVLRIDTNERNLNARRMYAAAGYEEKGIIPCEFNGIPDVVNLVLLEKYL